MNSSPASQADKAQVFRALNATGPCFVMPNPWDAGSARVLTSLGFQALATTSAGLALARGEADQTTPFQALLDHLVELTAATDLPVSADLGSGFGEAPEDVARTILLAAGAGVVGASIEDASGRPDDPLHARAFAAERIRAAVEAARSLPFPFVLTARAENQVVGRPDLADTIGRLQAYQEAGADVLYAPGLTRPEDIAALVREVDRPVNVLIGFPGLTLGVKELADLGVRRISVGGSLARAAYGGLRIAATQLRDQGMAADAQGAVSGRPPSAARFDTTADAPVATATPVQARPVATMAAEAPARTRPSHYPEPFASRMAGRHKRPLGDLFDLTRFGVNLTRLAPHSVSSLRHAHTRQDEFIYILQGRPTLHTDAGHTALSPGMCAGFQAGTGHAHRLINDTAEDVVYLEVGDRTPGDEASYPDDDLQARLLDGRWRFAHKDGTPYREPD